MRPATPAAALVCPMFALIEPMAAGARAPPSSLMRVRASSST